jgi:hypothetical protein
MRWPKSHREKRGVDAENGLAHVIYAVSYLERQLAKDIKNKKAKKDVR